MMPCSTAQLHGVPMSFGRNVEIYGEGEPAAYVYKVLSGSVRSYKVLGDGRRQVIGFHLAGDMFGFDCEAEHSCSAEAIADCQILLVRRTTLLNVAERDIDVARSLWTLTATQLKRAHEHSMLLIKTAQERLVAFLLVSRSDCPRRTRSISDVAPGYCRPSGIDDRNRFENLHPIVRGLGHPLSRVPAHCRA